MADVEIKQNSFIGGLITREAQERSDKPAYYHSAVKLTNVKVRVQGGICRRQGTKFIGPMPKTFFTISTGMTYGAPNGGDVSKLTNGDITDMFKTTTLIGTTVGYVSFVCSFSTPTYVDYYDIYMCSINNGDLGTLKTSEMFEIQYTADGTTWECAKTIHLSSMDNDSYRGAVHATVTAIRVINNFNENLGNYVFWCGGVQVLVSSAGWSPFHLHPVVYNATMNYLLIFSDNSITVFRNSVPIYVIPTPQISPNQVEQLKFCSFGESLIITHIDIPPLMVQRYKSDNVWRIFPLKFPMVPRFESTIQKTALAGSLSISEEDGGYTVSGDSDTFYNNDIGCLVYGNGGSARLVAYTNARTVSVSVINKFSSYGDRKVTGWTIDRTSLPLWGPDYGYPECSGFFANRLWLAGFKRTPRTIAGSVIGDYLNFDPGGNEDDDAILVSLSSGATAHTIRHIFASDNLEVFTDTGIFSLKKFDAGTQTELATAFYFRQPVGIEPYLAPFHTEDGGTLFIKRGRNDIRELSYDDEKYRYDARSRTMWCSSAIRGARSVCVVSSDDSNISNLVLLVNGDGNIACTTFLLSDNIHPTALWTTQGYYMACCATLQQTYVATERNGSILLEEVRDDAYLDAEVAYYDCSGGELSGLQHLAGMTVQVRADDEYLGEFGVAEDGTVTIPEGHWNVVHVGLGYPVEVIPVPPENTTTTFTGHWMNYSKALISCYDTQEILVDGYVPEFLAEERSYQHLGVTDHKSGRYRVFLGGTPSLMPQLHVTQPRPLDFNIRGISYVVDMEQHKQG
jgi:hypothetical protein